MSDAPLLRHDLHLHTYLSACCSAKDEQRPALMIDVAREMGMDAIGFADHIWVNPDYEPSGWYKPQDAWQIARLREDLKKVDPKGVRVLVGCEAETVAPGIFGMTESFARTLDYVLLSCSHIHMKGFVSQPENEEPATVGRHLATLFRSGVQCAWVTAIAHPFVPFGRMERYADIMAAIPDSLFAECFGLAAEKGVALEITTTFLPPEPTGDAGKPSWTLETPLRVIALARAAGCRFTFGSDAHTRAQQQNLAKLSTLVAQAGLTQADIFPVMDL